MRVKDDPYARLGSMSPSRLAHHRNVMRASCVFCRSVFQAAAVPAHVVDRHKAELAVLRWPVVLP